MLLIFCSIHFTKIFFFVSLSFVKMQKSANNKFESNEKVSEQKVNEQVALGIDFGTSTSLISALKTENGNTFQLENSLNHKIFKSNIFIGEESGSHAVGELIENKAATHRIIFDNKRFIGRQFQQIKDCKPLKNGVYPYIIKENEKTGTAVYCLKNSDGSEEIINTTEVAILNLTYLRDIIENNLGNIGKNRVCITIPAYYDHYQKQATLIAGKL